MTGTPDYRFNFTITDENTGDVISASFTSFDTVDEFGGCEAVDHEVAAVMRAFKRAARAKHEAENYPKNDKQLVTQTAERIRSAARAAGEKIT